MSVAWTTLLVIALLLPGVFFLIGVATRERYSKEIVRTSGFGELGVAFVLAIILHLFAWGILSHFGFILESFLLPIFIADHASVLPLIADHLWKAGWYTVAISLISFGLGWLAGRAQAFAKHRWIGKLGPRRSLGAVTAYVMTNIVENNCVMLYEGQLQEYFLTQEGRFSYIVLSNCRRFFLEMDRKPPRTGEHVELFDSGSIRNASRLWNYLMIDGSSINNVLFEKVPEIKDDPELEKQLDEIVQRLRSAEITRLKLD